MAQSPVILKGVAHLDDRGSLFYNNPLDLSNFRRAYIIRNSDSQPFRGWHGHEVEEKMFITLVGRIRFGAVRVRDWSNPNPDELVHTADLVASSMDAF